MTKQVTLSYRDVDFESLADRELLATWNNDPSVKCFYNRFPDRESAQRPFTATHYESLGATVPSNEADRNLMVLHDRRPVGHAVFELAPPKLQHESPNTGWIALMIGDNSLKRCGLGTRVVEHLESIAAKAGAKRIEIGVFEFNHLALSFFHSRGA